MADAVPITNTKLGNHIRRKKSAKSREQGSLWNPVSGRNIKDTGPNKKKIASEVQEVISAIKAGKEEYLYAPVDVDELLDIPELSDILKELIKKSEPKVKQQEPKQEPKQEPENPAEDEWVGEYEYEDEWVDEPEQEQEQEQEEEAEEEAEEEEPPEEFEEDEEGSGSKSRSRSKSKKKESPPKASKQRSKSRSKSRSPKPRSKSRSRSPKHEPVENVSTEFKFNVPNNTKLNTSTPEEIITVMLQVLSPQEILNCVRHKLSNSDEFKNSDQYKLLVLLQKQIEGIEPTVSGPFETEEVPSVQKSPKPSLSKTKQSPPKVDKAFLDLVSEIKDLNETLATLKKAQRKQLAEGKEELMAKTEKIMEETKDDIKALMSKFNKKYPDKNFDDFSFGRTNPQSYKRMLRSGRRLKRSNKKNTRRNIRKRFSAVKKLINRKKSLKKGRVGLKKSLKKIRRNRFGKIYGLQTPQTYTGVYPLASELMSPTYMGDPMNRSVTLPTLENIHRTYTNHVGNEMGSPGTRTSFGLRLRKKRSKKSRSKFGSQLMKRGF